MPALTVSVRAGSGAGHRHRRSPSRTRSKRSEEHTSELQSRFDLVCRLLLEKKKKNKKKIKQAKKQNAYNIEFICSQITTLVYCVHLEKHNETIHTNNRHNLRHDKHRNRQIL